MGAASPSVRCRWIIFLLFLISGACGLIYEVVWSRMLVTIFGNTVFAAATVLASFMAGLGLGSLLLGRIADRRYSLLQLYGWLEIAIGLSALAVTPAMTGVESVYVAIGRAPGGWPALLDLVRFVLSFLVLLVPTSLMGGTLPVLSRHLVRDTSHAGRYIGLLYALNTLGAVAGTLAAGFWLLPSLGMSRTTAVAVVFNLAVGAIALFLARRSSGRCSNASLPVGENEVEAQPEPAAGTPAAGPGYRAAAVRLSLLMLAVSGFTALAYEVIFFRILVLVIGTTAYAFATMLATFLCGIALGSALFALVVDRLSRLLLGLGMVQILLGWVVWLSVLMFCRLPRIFLWLTADGTQTWGRMVGIKFLLSFLLLLVPTLLLGGAFPIVSRVVARSPQRVGSSVGQLYVFNTAGAILGSLAAGFVLVPWLGLQASVLAVLVLNLVCGTVLVWFERDTRTPARISATTLALAAVVVSTTLTGPWNRAVMASGVYLYSKQYVRQGVFERFEQRVASADIAFYREGLGATVSVHRSRSATGDELLSIQIDGKTVASSEQADMRLQRTIGHLPILLCPESRPEPRQVLVIGLGAGVTAGACARHPQVEVTIVEIEQAVVGAARIFSELNHGVVDHPRASIEINDGRNHLLMTDTAYDVITVDPIHPFAAGSSSLYSREFYQLCRHRLRPQGVMCQWLPLYELSTRDLAMIMRTFQSAFSHSSVWLTGADVGLIGTLEPLAIELEDLAARMSHPSIRHSLAGVHLADPYALVSRMILGSQELQRLTSGAPLNTDDHLILEYSAPRSMYTRAVLEHNLDWLVRSRTSLLQGDSGKERLAGFNREVLERFVRSRDEVILGFAARPFDQNQSLAHFKRALAINPDDPDAADQVNQVYERLRRRGRP